MISLRAAGTDDNVAAEVTAFVSVPRPLGIRDGDLLLIAVGVPAAGVTVTEPDGWTKIARTDPSRTVSVAVYWKHAANEPVRWVFGLSSATRALGAVLAYANADGFEPVEASSLATTAASATHNVGGISTSLDGEELALFAFAGPAGSASFSVSNGFVEVATKQQSSIGCVSASHRSLDAAGALAPFTIGYGTLQSGASALVALRPGVGKLSVDDVRRLVVRGFPRGVEKIYDLAPGGDYYKYFQSWASLLKTYAYDLVDLLRLEATPYLSRYKLPDWERAFGTTTTRTARGGTVPQRQQQVLGDWRAAAGQGCTTATLTAVVGALLGYLPATAAQVVECSRADLDAEDTYSNGAALTVLNGATGSALTEQPHDGGVVSRAGVRAIVEFASGDGAMSFTLTGPGGTAKTWDLDVPVGTAMLVLYGAEFAGAEPQGNWKLSLTNSSGATVSVLWSVVIDGIGPGQTTGGAVFDWGVYADPDHMGESGVPADLPAARLAIQKLAHAHTAGNLIQSLTPLPDVDSGVSSAISDECVPTA